MKKQNRRAKGYDTDVFMKNLYTSLVRDFRSVMGSDYKQKELIALRHSIVKLRSMKSPDRLQAPPAVFKMEAQLENLFKRYRFKTDMYTDRELEIKTFETFSQVQLRLGVQDWHPLRHRTFLVLQKARRIVREILQDFDPLTLDEFCRFSTRATVGNPARDAYIDHKLADPITGSPEHIKWFKSHLRSNGYLRDVLTKCSPTGEPCFEVCESLPLVGVPKSYKTERLISPNTLIGSYYTYGLGSILVLALKAEGMDIAKLQDIHKKRAREASIHRAWVTADLSAASESFLWTLIARLCPRKWLNALNRGRLRYFEKNGERYNYCSFMAMGIGFTFPLQTLLFYAIAKAVCNLLKIEGLISVYGDDLIYPRRAHPYIRTVLEDLGMVLNKDKTFVESHFRESCGGDYYHGVDVRPFSPEGGHQVLTRRKYEAFVYQMANGLSARWDDDVIPITSRFLRLQVLRVANLVKQVPPSFPDYSGIRVTRPDTNVFSGMLPVLCRFRNGSREYVISHLVQTPQRRFVSYEDAYLYDWLRAKDCGEDSDTTDGVYLARGFDAWLHETGMVKRLLKPHWSYTRDSLFLFNLPKQPRNYRSSVGNRLKRTIACTPCSLQPQRIQTSVTDSISDWI